MKIRQSLRLWQRFMLVYVLFAAGLLTFVGVLAYSSGRSSLEGATHSALLSTAAEKVAALDSWVIERQADLATITASRDVQDDLGLLVYAAPGSPVAQTAHDRLVKELLPNADKTRGILTIVVIAPQSGQVIAATDPDQEGTFKEDRAYFINGKLGPYVQAPYYSLKLQQPTIALSIPLRADNGQLLGVLAANLNLDQLASIVGRRTGVQQSDDAYLVNTANLFVSQPRFISDPAVLQRGIHTAATQNCLAGNSGVVLANDYRGVAAISVYRWLPERQLCLIVSIDQAEAFQPVQAFGTMLALIGGLALIMAVLLALGLSRALTRPLSALQTGVTRFGQGDLAVRLAEGSGDELGVLAREFNSMAAALSQKDHELRSYMGQLEQRVHERTAALLASEAELRALFAAMRDVILVIDKHGRYLRAAPTNPALLYKPAPDLIGHTLQDIFPRAQADHFLEVIDHALQANQPIDTEYALTLNGVEVWFAATISPVSDASVLWVARDITERRKAQETRSMLAAIVESSDDAIIGKTLDGVIITWNKGAERLYGYSAEEAIGHSISTLIPTEHSDDLPMIMDALKKGDSLEHYETVRQRKDGARLDVSLTVSPIKDSDGRLTGASAITRDMTERKRAAEERTQLLLREQVARTRAAERDLLRTLIDHLPDYIFVKDPQGRFLVSNLAHARAAQAASADDLIGKTAFDFFPRELAEQYEADDQQVIDSGQAVINAERTTIDANGEKRVVLTNKLPWRNAEGELIGLIGTSRDITHRKQVEDALRRSEALEHEQRELAEALHDIAKTITSTLDPKLVMSHVLDNVGRVLAHDTANIMLIDGDTAHAAYWRGYSAELETFLSSYAFPVKSLHNLSQMLATGAPCLIADPAVDPEWVSLPEGPIIGSYIGAPIKIHGEVIGFLDLNSRTPGFFLPEHLPRLQAFADLASIAVQNAQLYEGLSLYAGDLEKRVQERTAELQHALEQEKELGGLKSRFITIASHEFRTPLTVISSSSGLLAMAVDKMTGEQRARNFNKIQAAVEQMVNLLDQTLTFDQANADRLEFKPGPLNLETLCQELLQEMQSAASSAHHLTFASNGPCSKILADKELLRRIIANLLSNAIKYSPAGGSVHVELTCQPDRAIISIEDHGIGIPQDDRSHIFEPFHRAANVGTLRGTGLGLSIVRKAVELHGGTIEFTSQTLDGKTASGTTFIATIPCRAKAQ